MINTYLMVAAKRGSHAATHKLNNVWQNWLDCFWLYCCTKFVFTWHDTHEITFSHDGTPWRLEQNNHIAKIQHNYFAKPFFVATKRQGDQTIIQMEWRANKFWWGKDLSKIFLCEKKRVVIILIGSNNFVMIDWL